MCGYHNDSIKEWYKPFISKDRELAGIDGHRSCWDCGNLRLRGQFNRKCIQHGGFIYSGDSEGEIRDEMWSHGNTRADMCGDYFLNPDIEKVLKQRRVNE